MVADRHKPLVLLLPFSNWGSVIPRTVNPSIVCFVWHLGEEWYTLTCSTAKVRSGTHSHVVQQRRGGSRHAHTRGLWPTDGVYTGVRRLCASIYERDRQRRGAVTLSRLISDNWTSAAFPKPCPCRLSSRNNVIRARLRRTKTVMHLLTPCHVLSSPWPRISANQRQAHKPPFAYTPCSRTTVLWSSL
jgi:hypothetical protein